MNQKTLWAGIVRFLCNNKSFYWKSYSFNCFPWKYAWKLIILFHLNFHWTRELVLHTWPNNDKQKLNALWLYQLTTKKMYKWKISQFRFLSCKSGNRDFFLNKIMFISCLMILFIEISTFSWKKNPKSCWSEEFYLFWSAIIILLEF